MTQTNTKKERIRVHPGLDFTSTNAYICHMLPRLNGDAPASWICLIRDDGAIYPIPDVLSGETEISLTHKPFTISPRWSAESIEAFSKGEATIAEKVQLLNILRKDFHSYVELPDERLNDFLSLWCIGTYFFPLFNAYPYVYVGGISASGKTKLLAVCSCFSFNAIFSANMSTACIYRLIQNSRCALFIDETEQLSSGFRVTDFRNILLSGYKKGMHTYRNRKTKDDDFVPESFEVYGPKMLANIEQLEDVLESRCISIIMSRGTNRAITDKEVDINDAHWQETRDLLYPFIMKNWKAIKQTYLEIQNDTTLSNRNWELWKPILALAKFFDSNDLLNNMKKLAVEKTLESKRDDSETDEYVLVETLLSLVANDGYYSLTQIIRGMLDHLEQGNWLSARTVGRLLRRLGFSARRRVRTGTEYFLKASQVKDVAKKLGISADGEVSEASEVTVTTIVQTEKTGE